jgi:hypothetical protein
MREFRVFNHGFLCQLCATPFFECLSAEGDNTKKPLLMRIILISLSL